ncbi:MAG: hypothetical protein S4CHLAM102_00550 [Chlamydiia bacterium]|nr:hypothetical protein [Chlamydiia bacterium]
MIPANKNYSVADIGFFRSYMNSVEHLGETRTFHSPALALIELGFGAYTQYVRAENYCCQHKPDEVARSYRLENYDAGGMVNFSMLITTLVGSALFLAALPLQLLYATGRTIYDLTQHQASPDKFLTYLTAADKTPTSPH